jgi:hypothetical protein
VPQAALAVPVEPAAPVVVAVPEEQAEVMPARA